MSLLDRVKKLEAKIKPKKVLRVIYSESEVTDEENVVFVLFNI